MFLFRSEVCVRRSVLAACLTGILAIAFFLPTGAAATVITGGCLGDRSPIGLNCTSNDLTFVLVGLGTQTDGCVQSGLGFCSVSGGQCAASTDCPPGETCEYLDEVDIFLRAVVRNTTAQTRYDVGLWFSTDGDENGDGALTGTCGREMIHPLGVCSGSDLRCNFDTDCGAGQTCNQVLAQTCPPLDLIGNDTDPAPPLPQGPANGPFLTADSVVDRCGDLFAQGQSGCDENNDGLWDDNVLDFDRSVTIPCSDIDNDGFVNIGTCASWGNQEDQVHLGVCQGGTNAGETCSAANQCGGGGTCAEQGVCNELSTDPLMIGVNCTGDADCGGTAGSCEFGGADTCDSEWELFNGTAAKCRCEQVNSNIPTSSLSLQCSLVNQCTVGLNACDSDADCDVGDPEDVCVTPSLTMPEMSSRIFDLTFANGTPAGCTPTTSPADLNDERFQCGTASFVQWDLADDVPDADPRNGTFENIVDESTGGTTTAVPDNTVTWTPLNDLDPNNGVPGSLGVIYPGHTGTLRFKYRLGTFATTPDMVTIDATTYFANAQSFMPRVAQTLTASCPLLTVQTWAAVSDVRAFTDAGPTVVEWSTSTEVATKAFELYRLEGRSWVPVGDGPVASRMAGDGGVYRVVDPHAYPGETVTYRLVEVTFDGARRSMGPYTVTVGAGTADAKPVPGRRPAKGADLRRGGAAAPAREVDGPAGRPLATGALAHEATPRQLARVRRATREYLGIRQRPAGVPTATLKVDVAADGVYRVPAADLAGQWGITAGEVEQMILGGGLRVVNRGDELAWAGAADGSELYFFGRDVDDAYTAANVYSIEPFPGTPATTVSGGDPAPVPGGTFQEQLVLERNVVAATNAVRQSDVDFWFWKGASNGVQPPIQPIATFPVAVPGATPAAGELSVRLYSVTDTSVPQEHTAIVRLNGTELGATTWEDIRFHEATFPIPAGVLQDGPNQIEVEAFLAGGVSTTAFFVDRFVVSYQRELRAENDRLVFTAGGSDTVTIRGFSGGDLQALDITDPLAVRRVTDLNVGGQGLRTFEVSFVPESGHRYAVSRAASLPVAGNLRLDVPSAIKASSGAQYVVVAPAHLVGPALGLTSLHRDLSSMVVDVEDVYDEFNDGLASPRALGELMRWTTENWSVKPEYLVLVGAGTFDYKGYTGIGGNLIPPALVATPEGIYASDQVFGDVDGDSVPDVAVGRIPVLTAAELEGYVLKLKRVLRDGGPDWRTSALFVADNQDSAGDFKLSTNRVSAHLGQQYATQKIFRDDLPAATARQQLHDALNAGVGFFNYIGHGGVLQLADEALLTTADAAALTNADRPGIMATLTCIAGRFELPTVDSVAEAMVLNPNGGASAAWAPSGLSYNVDAERLNRAFVDAAFGPEITLGQAVRQALASYADEGFYRHLLLVYNVFGDPALSMR